MDGVSAEAGRMDEVRAGLRCDGACRDPLLQRSCFNADLSPRPSHAAQSPPSCSSTLPARHPNRPCACVAWHPRPQTTPPSEPNLHATRAPKRNLSESPIIRPSTRGKLRGMKPLPRVGLRVLFVVCSVAAWIDGFVLVGGIWRARTDDGTMGKGI